jgi:protein-tyrosine-phosphatase
MLFRSAGFLSAGKSSTDPLVQVLAEMGVDARHHSSYRIDEASLAKADLVITMEGSHVRQATSLLPSAYGKILPLTELAALVDELPPGPVAVEDLLVMLEAQRDPSAYLGEHWDIADPYGRKIRAYRRAVAEIDELVTRVFTRLR